MKIVSLLVAGYWLLVTGCFVHAEQSEPNDVNRLTDISSYLRHAELHNAALAASFEEWQMAIEQVPQAKALPDPKFTYKLETRRSPHGQTFGISQMLPWFGTIEAATGMATASQQAAQQRYQSQRLKLFAEVKGAFYDYAFLARQLEIAKANLELLKHFEEVSRTRYAASQATQPDVIRAQIEIATMENEIGNIERFREPVAARLDSILNRPAVPPLAWPQQEKFKDVELNHQQLVALLIRNNPQLCAKDFEIAAAQKNLELAKKKFYPQMEVGVEAMYQSEATMGEGKQPLYATVSFTLPLWRDSYSASQRQASAQIRKVRQEKTQTQNDLVKDTQGVLYDYENSVRKVKLYRDTLIPKTKE
ncbi:MAG: TolC family protein, partial [Sedimentisphaerales bacterium]|nr:TolC family protein [Sedimentisphaerales bacterium]